MVKRKVAVTGIGAICCLGSSIEEVWANALNARVSVSPIPQEWRQFSQFRSKVWAPLPAVDFEARGVPQVELLRTDRCTLNLYLATLEALQNSGLDLQPSDKIAHAHCIPALDPGRTGIYMGTGIGGIKSLVDNYAHQVLARRKPKLVDVLRGQKELLNELEAWSYPPKFNPFVVPMLMANAVSAFLGIKLSITGPNTTTTLACAAGAAAIGQAYKAIRDGDIDTAICGGTEYVYDHYGACFRGFDAAGTLTTLNENPERASRPFDKDRKGFLFSEGASATLILEDFAQAKARKANILAEICGCGASFDAYNMLRPDPSGEQAVLALNRSLQDGGLSPEQIDYVNTHGTGTETNDQTEAALIEKYFPHGPFVNATKSLTGHAIGASGALEAAITILSLYHQKTHGCHNLDNPIAELNFVRDSKTVNVDSAVSQSFAFGGHNIVLAMRRV